MRCESFLLLLCFAWRLPSKSHCHVGQWQSEAFISQETLSEMALLEMISAAAFPPRTNFLVQYIWLAYSRRKWEKTPITSKWWLHHMEWQIQTEWRTRGQSSDFSSSPKAQCQWRSDWNCLRKKRKKNWNLLWTMKKIKTSNWLVWIQAAEDWMHLSINILAPKGSLLLRGICPSLENIWQGFLACSFQSLISFNTWECFEQSSGCYTNSWIMRSVHNEL